MEDNVASSDVSNSGSGVSKVTTNSAGEQHEEARQPDQEQLVNAMLTIHQSSFQGPLPPPELIERYAQSIPNGGDRIMTLAEKEQQHRHNLENNIHRREYAQSNTGQYLAAIISLSLIGAATYCIVNGFQWPGSLLGVLGITGLATAFIKGRPKNDD